MMKTNFTHILLIRILLFVLICLYSILVFGQDAAQNNPSTSVITNAKAPAEDNLLSGTFNGEKVSLQWSFAVRNDVNTVVIEKGNSGNAYKDLAIFWVNVDGNNQSSFKYADKQDAKKTTYYRLKVIENSGKVYYSNVFEVAGKKKK